MDRTNSIRSAKSPTYYDELHKEGFISDAQLAAAKSGNQPDMDAADAQVLSLFTFTAERPLTQKQSSAIHSAAPVSSENLHARQRTKDQLLKKNYVEKGYRFVDSKVANHNCLITSILQHATNDYTQKHGKLAQEYRAKLNAHLQEPLTRAQKKKFLPDDLLDAHHTEWLLTEMAKEKQFKARDLAVELWVAGYKGEPVRFTFGDGKNRAIIFNSTDHFEAVIPPSSNATTANSATTTTSTPNSQTSTASNRRQ